jgi:GH43 family beta-xylosidase
MAEFHFDMPSSPFASTVKRRNRPSARRGFSPRSTAAPELASLADVVAAGNPVVANPLLQAPAQDPQITWIDGRYYYCESSSAGIFLRVAERFWEIGQARRIRVWATPGRGPAARNIWAPELHVIDGRCYIYFAADDGHNENHRMWVLAAASADPLGPYELVGALDTGGWAIDGTVFATGGARYFVWSGWPGVVDGQQNLYISPMDGATRLAGERVLLATPDQPWERNGMPICEGPQVLQRYGKTFIVYSASASWKSDYCLGMLVHEGGELMNPASWRKVGPTFERNEHAWGVGHCGFLKTAEGEDWLFYHSKTSRKPGWGDREVRAQPFAWDQRGWPVLGEPMPVERPLPVQSARLGAA